MILRALASTTLTLSMQVLIAMLDFSIPSDIPLMTISISEMEFRVASDNF